MGLLNSLTDRLTTELIKRKAEALFAGASKEVEASARLGTAIAFGNDKERDRAIVELFKRIRGFTASSLPVLADDLSRDLAREETSFTRTYALNLMEATKELVAYDATYAPLLAHEWDRTFERGESFLPKEVLKEGGRLQAWLEQVSHAYDWDAGVAYDEREALSRFAEYAEVRLGKLPSRSPAFSSGYLSYLLESGVSIGNFRKLATFAVADDGELALTAAKLINQNFAYAKPEKESLAGLVKILESKGHSEALEELMTGFVGRVLEAADGGRGRER